MSSLTILFMCVLLAITAEKQEVVKARRGSLGTRDWDQATMNETLASVKRDFPLNATSVTQPFRRLKRIPRLKRKGGSKTAFAEAGAYAGIALLDWGLGLDQKNKIAAMKRRMAKKLELQAQLKGPQQVKQMLNRIRKCTNRDQGFILHDDYVLELFRVFPGRVPCFACHCSAEGEIEHCRKCLRSEEITAGNENEIEECYRGDGKDYRGKVQRTEKVDVSGWWEIGKTWRIVQCQAWSAQEPHEHGNWLYKDNYDPKDRIFVPKYTPETEAWAGLEGSFCRNPSGAERPWCYTMSNKKKNRWAYCDIPKCEESWRPNSNRCGPAFPVNGKPGECNPKGESPCCSEDSGWCGKTDAHCRCDNCVDYSQDKPWKGRDVRRPKKDYSNQLRTDRRCGPRFRKNGKPGECDPDSLDSCCNEERGVCGNSAEDCDCGDKCVDYWLKREWKHILEERKQIEKERPLKDGEYWDDLFTIVGTEESIDDVI